MTLDEREAELWKRFDAAIQRMLDARENWPLAGEAPIWTKLTYTYTTNTTADPASQVGYSEGFDDGWNAHEATVPRVKG